MRAERVSEQSAQTTEQSSDSSIKTTESKSMTTDTSSNINAFNVDVTRVAKLTEAQKRSVETYVIDDFKNALNKCDASDTLSAWVAYKISLVKNAARTEADVEKQNKLYALYIKQSRKLTTDDVNAIVRNARVNHTEYTFESAIENVTVLRKHVDDVDAVRIVQRSRSAVRVSVESKSAARENDAATAERVAQINAAVSAEAQRVAAVATAERDAALAARETDALLIAEQSARIAALSAQSEQSKSAARKSKQRSA